MTHPIRRLIQIVESAGQENVFPALYHGTCASNAASLVQNGWAPRAGGQGGNMGQTRFLYLSTVREDALWFAEQKGCDAVVEVRDVPLDHLRVDPEDGSWDTLEDELAGHNGLPGKVVLTKPLPARHFRQLG